MSDSEDKPNKKRASDNKKKSKKCHLKYLNPSVESLSRSDTDWAQEISSSEEESTDDQGGK